MPFMSFYDTRGTSILLQKLLQNYRQGKSTGNHTHGQMQAGNC